MSTFAFLTTNWPSLHDAASNAAAALSKLDALFSTLQQRAFKGDL